MDEKWKDIPGYNGFYQASSFGRIKSVDRFVPCPRRGRQFKKGKILKQTTMYKGYNIVVLSQNGKPKTYRVNRVILRTFVGEPPCKKSHGMHLDGDRSNNYAYNLRWGSPICNAAFKKDDGTNAELEKHPMAKLNNKKVLQIVRQINSGKKQKDIAKNFDVSPSTISAINNGQNWSELTGRGL